MPQGSSKGAGSIVAMSSSWESREGNSAANGNTSSMDTSVVDTFAAEGTSAGDPASSLYEGKEGGPDSCASTWIISGTPDYEGGSYPGRAGAGEGGGYIDNPRVEGDPVSGGAYDDVGDGGESGSYAFDGGGGGGAGEGGGPPFLAPPRGGGGPPAFFPGGGGAAFLAPPGGGGGPPALAGAAGGPFFAPPGGG